MNWLDAAILALIAWFTFAAFQAGFIRESVTVVGALLGVILAGIFYVDLAEDVLLFIDNETVARIVAFGVLFAATALAGQMVALVLKPGVEFFQLGIFDQLAGAAFGFTKAMIFVEVFVIVFITYPRWDIDKAVDDSFIASLLLKNTPYVVNVMPSEFELSVDAFNAGVPASFPDNPDYEYEGPGNIPPQLRPD
jgi:membrane protein required for colicin V production